MNQTLPLLHDRPASPGHRQMAWRAAVLLCAALALAGCGKKGAPQPPSDEPDTFQRTYPSV